MDSPAVTNAVLANIALALGISGGAHGVIRVFAPAEVRDLLPTDVDADAEAVAFFRNVEERSSCLALLAQAVETTDSVPVVACMQDLTEAAGLKRELVRLEGRLTGLEITTLPIAGGRWWTEQASAIEARDVEGFFAPPPRAPAPRITVRPLPKVPLVKPTTTIVTLDDDDDDNGRIVRRKPAAKRTKK